MGLGKVVAKSAQREGIRTHREIKKRGKSKNQKLG